MYIFITIESHVVTFWDQNHKTIVTKMSMISLSPWGWFEWFLSSDVRVNILYYLHLIIDRQLPLLAVLNPHVITTINSLQFFS